MVLLENVIDNYGIKNIKILFTPAKENEPYVWLRIERVGTKCIAQEEHLDTVYFRNDVNGRFEKSMPAYVLQHMIDCEYACIILQEHRRKSERMKVDI